MMKTIRERSRFKRDYRHLPPDKKLKVANVVQGLRYGFDPPPSMLPHDLTGDFQGWTECHVEPNLLLVYCVTDELVYLYRVGSHSKIFG